MEPIKDCIYCVRESLEGITLLKSDTISVVPCMTPSFFGHLLMVPTTGHVISFSELSKRELYDMSNLYKTIIDKFNEKLDPKPCHIGMVCLPQKTNGNSDHLMTHIFPIYQNNEISLKDLTSGNPSISIQDFVKLQQLFK